MNTLKIFILIALLTACNAKKENPHSATLVTDATAQDTIFNNLLKVSNNSIPESKLNDSLAFLILPVQASCPSCREKTIDSIVGNQHKLDEHHFIVISANAGRKAISSYFRERDYELPVIADKLFLDSINQAYQYELYTDKPTMYYTHNKKVYKVVAAIPNTVRKDLGEFFSGIVHEELE